MARFSESWKRSILKAITWRALIMILDFSIIYLFTRRVDVSLAFMLISSAYTLLAYYVHERFWNGVSWGKKNK